MGGGLGGGSADAAVTLLLLARLWNLAPDARRGSPEIAAELGSDVPFFLGGGQADVTGRGEIVTPVEDFPRDPAPAPRSAVPGRDGGRVPGLRRKGSAAGPRSPSSDPAHRRIWSARTIWLRPC